MNQIHTDSATVTSGVGRLPPLVTITLSSDMDQNQLSLLTAAIKSLERTLVSKTQVKPEVDETPTHKSHFNADNNNKQEKVKIDIRLVFLKLGEIDTLKEHFTASIFFALRWREPLLDGDTTDDGPLNFNDFWNPKILIDNALNDPKEIIWHNVRREDGKAFIVEKRRVKGNFQEKLELTDFPFDTQELTISLISERSEDEVYFVEDGKNISKIHKQSFVDEQEWHLHDHVDFEPITSNEEFSNAKYKRPGIKVMCRASRKPGYFIWNVVLIMLFIVGLSLNTFTVSPDKPENRIQVTFILVLSMVAFKFTVSNSLPKISYLTYLDIYVLMSFTFLCLVCIWHGIVQSLNSKDIDKYVAIAFGSVFFLYHLIFGIFIVALTQKERRLNLHRNKEYLNKVKAIQSGKEFGINTQKANSKASVVPV